MPGEASLQEAIHNRLKSGDLPFRDFVELVLYHPELGYYMRPDSPVGKAADFVTSPSLSPVFSYGLGELCRQFLSRVGDGVSQIVDIGAGDGALINSLASLASLADVGRWPLAVGRVQESSSANGQQPTANVSLIGVERGESLADLPPADARLVLSNELFDAQPFARLVRRASELHELTVVGRDGVLDWGERAAAPRYVTYFASRGIELDDGQFADVSLDWTSLYDEVCRFVARGLIVTFDYGYPQETLFRSRLRRYGTAAAYSRQRVSRDLLANPGKQDLTAHINFTDLIRAGERAGFTTLFFDRQAKFLLALGITEHELFKPIDEVSAESLQAGVDLLDRRDEARRLVLPDGIGEDIRVLVQGRGMPAERWMFQRKLF
jgi:SAM-dependent MidA family methyltransferase